MTSSYDLITAQQLMTLSTIAYAKDGKDSSGHRYSLSDIGAAIDSELKNETYATQKQWARVWGPVRSEILDNLIFIAHNSISNAYALVIRGTAPSALSALEDIPTQQVSFDYTTGGTDPKVSNLFLDGLKSVYSLKDDSEQTFNEYFELLSNQSDTIKIYVTGHSQGGGLTSMFLSYLLWSKQSWNTQNTYTFEGYAFAAPTAGNSGFANYIDTDTTCYCITNPLDVVPRGYDNMLSLVTDNIPTTVPEHVTINGVDINLVQLIKDAAKYVSDLGQWQQPSNQITLSQVAMTDSYTYLEQVGGQHNHNSYLLLLGAQQTDIGDPSPLTSS